MTQRLIRDEDCLPEYFETKKLEEKRLVVPEGMLKAAMQSSLSAGLPIGPSTEIEVILEAALRWLSKNPIVPTEEQERGLDDAWLESKRNLTTTYHKFEHASAFGAVEWQRRMFLAPERPNVSEWTSKLSGYTFTQEEADAIKEFVQQSVHPGMKR
jgi:hypothetical protein